MHPMLWGFVCHLDGRLNIIISMGQEFSCSWENTTFLTGEDVSEYAIYLKAKSLIFLEQF